MVVTRLNRSAVRFGAYKNGEPIGVATADEARLIASEWLASYPYVSNISYGLPEVDDRYGAWRIALLNITTGQTVGEIMISCKDGSILQATETVLISRRLKIQEVTQTDAVAIPLPIGEPTGADICYGDARQVLKELASGSIHLVITSPPYFNAKPEYSEYEDYESYLSMLREVFEECHRVLAEGRFLIVNLSPVLIRRAKRSESSRRIPVPFHVNSIIESVGYDFIDDIIWVKPAGAGWNTGRGRRFAADRHPLQYKPVPITEYFLVYRKHTTKLIDWNIRNHSDQEAVRLSRIDGSYEVTNVWHEKPAHHPAHPAVFPDTLIRKFIKYYSFIGDIVLDPFAGIGTVGRAAKKEGRGFFLVDSNKQFYEIMLRDLL